MTTKAAILKDIRAKCFDCSVYQIKEVELCPATECRLHPYRFGKDPNPSQSKSEAAKRTSAQWGFGGKMRVGHHTTGESVPAAESISVDANFDDAGPSDGEGGP